MEIEVVAEIVQSLEEMVDAIIAGNSTQAEITLSNLYYRHRRSAEDYQNLLREIVRHPSYTGADANIRGEINRLLYYLDRRFNAENSSIYVDAVPILPREEGRDTAYNFTIKENASV